MRALLLALLCLALPAQAQTLTGKAAYGDYQTDAPGVTRRITEGDLPQPYESRSSGNGPRVGNPPSVDAAPKVPDGFTVTRFAEGLTNPRIIRVAPNGDIFVAETAAGRVRVFRAADGATRPERNEVFAQNLDAPFGIAFYPLTGEPQYVYVANNNAVIRFPYRSGDLKARGNAEIIVPKFSDDVGGHSTRDVAFSKDGARMFVSVGSGSNVAEGMPKRSAAQAQRYEEGRGLGVLWGAETNRADVLAFDPNGRNEKIFATGIRNCVGLAVHPQSGDLWCSTNERDGLGDDLPPDYATRVKEGSFYGWPWYYIGNHEDPRHAGARPDLAGKATVPDVLIQPHSAPLQMTFYQAAAGATAAFPAEYNGDGFAALHGSWNRAKRTGYKIVRLKLKDGVPTGEYQDFLTGFVSSEREVWGRPVGVAMAKDGALLVGEDGNGTIWRVAPKK